MNSYKLKLYLLTTNNYSLTTIVMNNYIPVLIAVVILIGVGYWYERSNRVEEFEVATPAGSIPIDYDSSLEKYLATDTDSQTNNEPALLSTTTPSSTLVDLENSSQESLSLPRVTLKTSMGDIVLELFEQDAPKTVANFLKLTREGFYDGTAFHRVIPDFMIQGGDPNSKDDDWSNDGRGGPGYAFEDEFNQHKLVKGSLAMANAGPNTNGSQFFIVTAESTPWLDGKHTNFGRVVSGLDVVEAISRVERNGNDHPMKDVVVQTIEVP